jgi:hemerythrin-like domain-containing protein
MQPIGPLMIEHRLIERMIRLMAAEAENIRGGKAPDAEFIRVAVDFIRIYADKLHHGKEENILFRDLAKKKLSAEHRRITDELTAEHVRGRDHVRQLTAARDRYLRGDQGSAAVLREQLDALAKFYPVHIAKEDKHFFIPVMEYFTAAEQAALLREFYEFDRKFVHLAYREIVSALDGKHAEPLR